MGLQRNVKKNQFYQNKLLAVIEAKGKEAVSKSIVFVWQFLQIDIKVLHKKQN